MPRELRLYNTASRSIEPFTPSSDSVGIYCCGPTVYDRAHIGNLRTYVWEDVLVRTLIAFGYPVRHVVNITDVGHLTSDEDSGEDKMEKGARREGKTAHEIAEFYARAFKADLKSLRCREPDIWCRATDHIPEMITMVITLEERGYTYRTSDGIYFDTSKFPAYCDFARLDPETLRAGARIDMGDKKQPTDFALWKFSPAGAKRQMEWESPWGTGFPGWHIECSAMSLKYLPQPIDIHCGGQEHVRVHHTNEIAQAEAATGKPFVRYWIHGEWLMFDTGKMSKSAGGVVMLDELKEAGIFPLAYRMFALSAHHRSPINFTWDSVRASATGLTGLQKQIAELKKRAATEPTLAADRRVAAALDSFHNALADDLNTPKALAAVWDLVRSDQFTDNEKVAALTKMDAVLGLDLLSYEPPATHRYEIPTEGGIVKISGAREIGQSAAEVLAQKVAARKTARKVKDFALADRIRNELAAQGVDFKDLPDGSTECFVK
jgi:cysteinyl-tRNA synthetase